MRQFKKEYQELLPPETEAKLDEFCTTVAEIIFCMNYFGLQELRRQLKEINKTSQNREVVYLPEFIQYIEKNKIPFEPYTQFTLNIQLLYIKLYMIEEIISKYPKLPPLKIEELKMFRLVFTHENTDKVFSSRTDFVCFINWFKPDLSEISYRFFNFNGQKQKDATMFNSKNIQTFSDWYAKVFDFEAVK